MNLGKSSLACILAAVACGGADVDRQGEPASSSSHRTEPTEPAPPAPPRPPEPRLTALGDMIWDDCDSPSVVYEAFQVELNGMTLRDFECRWEFDDGTTSDSCRGDHLFAMGGLHIAKLVVRDPASGIASAPIEVAEEVFEPLAVELHVEAPECGLTFDYETEFIGGRDGRGLFRLLITPPDQVLTTGYAELRSGAIEVAAAGTYALAVRYEEEHPVGPICTAALSRSVTVTECEEPPPEPPPDDCPPDAGAPPPEK